MSNKTTRGIPPGPMDITAQIVVYLQNGLIKVVTFPVLDKIGGWGFMQAGIAAITGNGFDGVLQAPIKINLQQPDKIEVPDPATQSQLLGVPRG